MATNRASQGTQETGKHATLVRKISPEMKFDFHIYTGRYGSSVGQASGSKLPVLKSCEGVFIETMASPVRADGYPLAVRQNVP
jgi:hypothetical protein